jgi:phosphoglycolate phosphatase-like HAD superfamily hydrolase
MTNLFVFDFHGTLVEGNDEAVLESTNLSLEKHNRKERATLEFCVKNEGKPWSDYFKELCPDANEDEIKSMVRVALSFDDYVIPKYVKPIENSINTLEKIKRNGDTIIVVSSTNKKAFKEYLKHIKIRPLIDEFIGITGEKETKGGYGIAEWKGKKIKEFIGNNNFNEKYVIGNNIDDIKGGKIAGAVTLFFSKGGKKCPIADYSIKDLKEILSLT